MLDQLAPLLQSSLKRTFAPGATMLYQGEVPRSACVLIKGTARAFSISSQGDEQIVTYHTAGEFFPSSWLFGKTPGSLFFYEAVTACETALVPRAELVEFLTGTPERIHVLLDYFTTNYTASLIRISALEQPKAREKLTGTLFFLCQRHGLQLPNGKVRIKLSLTHQNLAGLVGLTRETTATEMNKLKKLGIITYVSQKYTVDKSKLLELMAEDSFEHVDISNG